MGQTAPIRFVGRASEIRVYRSLLQAASGGSGSVLLVSGEHGVGKTRLVREMAHEAVGRSFLPLWGYCDADIGAPAYRPWAEIIRDFAESRGPDETSALMGPGAADIAEIAPVLTRILPGLAPPPRIEPANAQFRLFDSMIEFIHRAAEQMPLIIIVDNLHNSDCGSLKLLERICRRLEDRPLIVVATFVERKVAEPLGDILADLIGLPWMNHLRLDNLDPSETEMLATETLESDQSSSVDIHRLTDGHPLFVSEVLRFLKERRLQELQDEASEITALFARIRLIISRRLHNLSESCRPILAAASILGRTFEVDLLAPLLGGDSETCEECIRQAEAEGLIVEDKPGSFRFVHELTQRAVSGQLSAAKRMRLHGEVAELLEGDPNGDPARIAFHHGKAGRPNRSRRIRFSVLAGEGALLSHAGTDALRHFNDALQAMEGAEYNEERPRVRLLCARALALIGRIDDAVQQVNASFEEAMACGCRDLAIAAAEFPWFPDNAGIYRALAPLRERALTLAGEDTIAEARLLCQLGLPYGQESREKGFAAFRKVLAKARETGDVELEVRALCLNTYLEAVGGNPAVWSSHVEAFDRVKSMGDLYAESWMRSWIGSAELALGHSAAVEKHADVLAVQAGQLRSPARNSDAVRLKLFLAQAKGRWADAGGLIRNELDAGRRDAQILGQAALMEAALGRVDTSNEFLEEFIAAARIAPQDDGTLAATISLIVPLQGLRTNQSPRWDWSEDYVERLLSTNAHRLHRAHALAGRAFRALESGVTDDLRRICQEMTTAVPMYTPWGHIHWDRVIGVFLAALGEHEEALASLLRAHEFCRRAGYAPELAWICREIAELSRESGAGLNHDYEVEGLEIAGDLGMALLANRFTASSSSGFPDGLSPREVDVIRLAAVGLANKQIAGELSISIHTVAHHLHNIFHKTKVQSRAELSHYAARHGLVSLGE